MNESHLHLRSLSLPARLGLSALVLVLLGGLTASVAFIYLHYQNRDDRPGLTMDDLRGAYHGVHSRAPLVSALERGHPETLAAADRGALLDWLLGAKDASGARPGSGNPRLAENYDNLDLGDAAPSEILARSCVQCHSARATQGGDIGQRVPLDNWASVKRFAFGKDISPTPRNVLVVSTHAHALSLGTMSIVAGALLLATAWPRVVVGWLIALMGLGLLVDIGSWWLARDWAAAVYGVVAGGAVYNATTAVSLVMVLADLWRPKRTGV